MTRLRLAFGMTLTLGITTALLSSSVHAAGEDCFRDTECGGEEVCVDGSCGTDGSPPQACAGDAECPDFGSKCSDGFCKYDGVACRNPAGACWVKNGSGHCECLDGDGAGWSDGYNPDDPPVELEDAELQDACGVTLVDVCGDSPPSLPDECTGPVLEHCEAYVAQEDALLEVCGDPVPSSPIARVSACCLAHDEPEQATYRECVLELDTDACSWSAWEACEYDGEGSQEGEAAGDQADANADTAKKGCRIGGERVSFGLLMLLGLVIRTRRRRAPCA